MKTEQEKLAFILNAKERYRNDARALSWEEKVASIERMRDAAKKARLGMSETLAAERVGHLPVNHLLQIK
jgi:hypothetical protein